MKAGELIFCRSPMSSHSLSLFAFYHKRGSVFGLFEGHRPLKSQCRLLILFKLLLRFARPRSVSSLCFLLYFVLNGPRFRRGSTEALPDASYPGCLSRSFFFFLNYFPFRPLVTSPFSSSPKFHRRRSKTGQSSFSSTPTTKTCPSSGPKRSCPPSLSSQPPASAQDSLPPGFPSSSDSPCLAQGHH